MNTIHNAIERRNYLQFDILVHQRIGLNKSDAKGLTPLMKVNHEPKPKYATEMLRLLIKQSAKLDSLDRKGRNALMHAALVGNSESVQMLLDAGFFDPAMRDYSGNAPVHYGAMSGDVATLKILFEHLKKYRVKVDLRNDQGMSPLHIACSQGHIEAARYLQSEGECSLTMRDGLEERTAREWLEQACNIPEYMDPFGYGADISLITPKTLPELEQAEDNSQVRIFVFMKEKPEIDSEEALPDARPPWDINTNVNLPPKYLPNGKLNPSRLRPGSARTCNHNTRPIQARPFSAPCGFSEFSVWKHPADMKPYLSVSNMSNIRRYSSVSDLVKSENNVIVRQKVTKLLQNRNSRG